MQPTLTTSVATAERAARLAAREKRKIDAISTTNATDASGGGAVSKLLTTTSTAPSIPIIPVMEGAMLESSVGKKQKIYSSIHKHVDDAASLKLRETSPFVIPPVKRDASGKEVHLTPHQWRNSSQLFGKVKVDVHSAEDKVFLQDASSGPYTQSMRKLFGSREVQAYKVPVGLGWLPTDPSLIVIDDFLTAEECDYLVHRSDRFDQASKPDSTYAFFNANDFTFTAEDGTVTSPPNMCTLQIQPLGAIDINRENYKLFQLAKPFLWGDLPDETDAAGIKYKRYTSERSKEVGLVPHYDDFTNTLLIYLNDVLEEAGGETLFDLLKVKVAPKRGRAVWFRSITVKPVASAPSTTLASTESADQVKQPDSTSSKADSGKKEEKEEEEKGEQGETENQSRVRSQKLQREELLLHSGLPLLSGTKHFIQFSAWKMEKSSATAHEHWNIVPCPTSSIFSRTCNLPASALPQSSMTPSSTPQIQN